MLPDVRDGSRRAVFDPDRLRIWHGPAPEPRHALLLKACLASPEIARPAWQQWVRQCDFDHEDAASHELAAFAVLRFGEEVPAGPLVSRSRGWFRRSWFLSQLALQALEGIACLARRRGEPLIVCADAAVALRGTTFSGHPFPVRSLHLRAAATTSYSCEELRAAVTARPAWQALRSGQLRLGFDHPRRREVSPPLTQSAPAPFDGLLVPETASLLVELMAANWRWHPPGQLRWVLELAAALEQGEPGATQPCLLMEVARRWGRLAAVQQAGACFVALELGDPLEQIGRAAAPLRVPRQQRWRLRGATEPPGSPWARGLRLFERARSRLLV
jgi:hypothetical protein